MSLVSTLAIILIAAGVFTVICRALKQPLILGYIIAGFLVGPNLGLIPNISMDVVHEWSEIGIVFLLFALGLEFSFKKLIKVGSSALISAMVKCIGMFVVGMVLGACMGWSTMESIFVGGLLSMSSTTIILKAYDEMGLKNRPHCPLLFGSLVFEDLIAVLLMVLLSTIAVSNSFSGAALGAALFKLVFFVVLWFVVGIFVLPSLLRWAHKYMTDEICLIIAIGLCFLMVVISEAVGFSSALGAFVMGSLLSETVEGERIEHTIGSIKDLFGAIFFVSVGMMVDPVVIGQYWLPIIIITLAFFIGILIFPTLGGLMTGQGLKDSIHVGFSLTVLGEFAFIIAGLGTDLGVMQPFFYPVVIAVSVITSFTAPYMIKAADPVSDWLLRVLPEKVVIKLSPSADANKSNSTAAESDWKLLLRTFGLRTLIFGVLIFFLMALCRRLLPEMMPNMSGNLGKWLFTIILFVAEIPFIYAFSNITTKEKQLAVRLIRERRHNRFLIQSIYFVRDFVVLYLVVVIFFVFLSLKEWVMLLIIALAIVMLVVVRKSHRQFTTIEDRFLQNLNEKERKEREAMPVTTSLQDKLSGHDVHIEPVEVPAQFSFVGKTLREMPFRHISGVNIVELMRGERCIRVPRGDERIFPHDILLAVGTSEQLASLRNIIAENTNDEHLAQPEFDVQIITIDEKSRFCGKTLRNSGLRAAGCLVVSILRNNSLITNPSPDECLQAGDKIWLAGEKDSLNYFSA